MRIPRLAVVVLIVAVAAGCFATAAPALEVGDKAPEFTLVGPGNKPVKLTELNAKGPIVLYTFIQAFTNT